MRKQNAAKKSLVPIAARCVSILLTVSLCLFSAVPSFAQEPAERIPKKFSAYVAVGGIVIEDSDFDGMPNAWESDSSINLDPNNPDDGYYDDDNDGITNLEEYRIGTYPHTSNSGILVTITSSVASGMQPLDVIFTGTVTNSSNPIRKYEWDFDGNGTYDYWTYASEGNTASYRFTADGPHNIFLRVTDSMGNTGVAGKTINVTKSGSSPTAFTPFQLYNIGIVSVLPFQGSDSSGQYIASYEWDMNGDGEYETSSSISGNIGNTFNETITRSFDMSYKVTAGNGLSSIAPMMTSTDATSWNESDSRPPVSLDTYVIYAVAGTPVSLRGTGIPLIGYTTKLEWDFEGDGIYDWVCSKDNASWNGRADVTHTYGSPGIYRATLRVNTEACVCNTDHILVIVKEAATTPPLASARVSYETTSNALSLTGKIPVKAVFNHSTSTGSIAKYEWDFDGDKKIDHVTTSASDTPSYWYTQPGYRMAMLKVTNTNGLEDTFYIPVFCDYNASYSSVVVSPFDGARVAGNALSVYCKVFPDDADVSSVTFQYRIQGTTPWTDVSAASHSLGYYKMTLDTTGLTTGSTYELRAVANDVTANAKSTFFIVDNSGNVSNPPDINEYNYGAYTKKVRVPAGKTTLIMLYDGSQITIPAGAVGSDQEMTITEGPNFQPLAGEVDGVVTSDYAVNIVMASGLKSFSKDVAVRLPYPYDDADADGWLDNVVYPGTEFGIMEKDLIIEWYNTANSKWERIYNSVVYMADNTVAANTDHLSMFGLDQYNPPSNPPGYTSSSAGGNGSGGGGSGGCFIATAAYGTPMAADVITLKSFRDSYLLKNGAGRQFVKFYYCHSPRAADFISNKPALMAAVRFMLKPFVRLAQAAIRIKG